MGKTASGAVWLSDKRLSLTTFGKYWRIPKTTMSGAFLRMFYRSAAGGDRRLEDLEGAEINEAKKILATETTRLCTATPRAGSLFGGPPAAKAFTGGHGRWPSHPDSRTGDADVRSGCGGGAAHGRLERRGTALIEQGGVKLNDQPVQSVTAAISGADLDERGTARLAVGKKRHGLIKRA